MIFTDQIIIVDTMKHIIETINLEELPSKTLLALKKIAKDIGVNGYYNLNKNDLIKSIITIVNYWKEMIRADELITQERAAKQEFQEKMHQSTRGVELRVQENVSDLIPCLEYPFEYIRNGEYDRVTQPIPGQSLEEIGEFPDNIAEYYWISEGENDERPWLTLCRLTNGVYVFYKGECDYTGFDCQGHMKIYASKDHSVLTMYGMSSEEYDTYYKETNVVEEKLRSVLIF